MGTQVYHHFTSWEHLVFLLFKIFLLQLVKDEQQWPWDPGDDLSNDPVHGGFHRSPHILKFSDVYGVPCSRVSDLIPRPKLQDAMDTLQYP